MGISHWYGYDINLTPAQTIAIASGLDNVSQRILRRILTAKGSYIWHLDYGIGAGKYVGPALSPALLAKIKADFRGQILSDAEVGKNPPPSIVFDTSNPNLVGVTIQYTYAPTGQLQTLSFNLPNG